MEISNVTAKKIMTEKLENTESVEKTAQSEKTQSVKSLEANSIEYSSDAVLHCETLELIKNIPDVRADRIADLKAKIKAGAYEIDAAKLAEKMIEHHLENELL